MQIPRFVFSLWLAAVLASGLALTTGGINKYERGQRQTVTVDTEFGWGSGFFVKRTGYDNKVKWFVWTADHVANKADKHRLTVKVAARDKNNRITSVDVGATVIARAEKEDLALLVLDDSKETARFVETEFASTETRVGDEVFVVGTPRQFTGTVSTGIVSQKNINPPIPGWEWKDLDQTTAPIFPGNSGGPVFNSNGQVVGVVVAGMYGSLNGYVPTRNIEGWANKNGLGWAIRGDRCPVTLPKLKELPPTPLPAPLKIFIPLFP